MSNEKTLDTLVPDIYNLFDPENDHICSEENLTSFAEGLKDIIRARLRKYERPTSPLRFSALGKQDLQVWFEAHPDPENPPEDLLPKTYLKFLYGDIIEAMLLLLVKEAGHTVTDEQAEVSVDGVKGHIDAIIDGVVVDVKSASPYGYKKFEDNSVERDDPFGYVAQLSGYSNVLTPGQEAAWLAMDKVGGDICVSTLSPRVIKHYPPENRIEHLKSVIASSTPPERCYPDTPDGSSGNRKLNTACSYCAHKFRCWENLRVFLYSNGPRYLTVCKREPNVPEA